MQKPKKEGFSIVELLVAIAIVGIMASASVPSVTRGFTRSNFESDTNQVWSLINEGRTNALASKKCPQGDESGTWRVTYTPQKIELFCASEILDAQEEPLQQHIKTTTLHNGFMLDKTPEGAEGLEHISPTISFLPQTAQIVLDGLNENFSLQIKSLTLEECVRVSVNRIAGFPYRTEFNNLTCN